HEPIFDYGNVDTSQAQRSWDSYAPYGWYGTNYVGLRGRMAILSEAYSHADFKTRVQVTHDFLVEILNYVARHGNEIRRLERAADSGVAGLLRLHGIQVQRLTAEWTDTVEVLTGTELKWATREFQGHQLLEVTGTWARASRRVPAGGYFVSTAQPLGRLVFALLEPEGFGLARWGAFSGAPGT